MDAKRPNEEMNIYIFSFLYDTNYHVGKLDAIPTDFAFCKSNCSKLTPTDKFIDVSSQTQAVCSIKHHVTGISRDRGEMRCNFSYFWLSVNQTLRNKVQLTCTVHQLMNSNKSNWLVKTQRTTPYRMPKLL